MRTSTSSKPIEVSQLPPDESWSAAVLADPDKQVSGSGDEMDWLAEPPEAGSYTVGVPVILYGVTRTGEIRNLGRWPLGGVDLTVTAGDIPIQRLLSVTPPEGIVALYAQAATVTGIPELYVRDVSVKVAP